MRAIVLISVPVAVITTVLVFWLSNRSFVGEATIALAIIAAGLFLFLTVGLYKGVQLQEPIVEDPEKPFGSESIDVGSTVGLAASLPAPDIKLDVPDLGGGGDDLVGCLVSLVLWVVVAILLMVLFWLFVQVLAFVLPWVLLALYWMFYRALRIVFAKADVCRGQLLRSMGYGLLYSTLYTGWLFLVLGILELIRMGAG